MIKTAKDRQKFRTTPQWLVFRKYVIALKCATCEYCGKTYKNHSHLNVHHMYKNNYDNLDISRFMLLCRTCHTFIHTKYNAPKFKHLKLVNRLG